MNKKGVENQLGFTVSLIITIFVLFILIGCTIRVFSSKECPAGYDTIVDVSKPRIFTFCGSLDAMEQGNYRCCQRKSNPFEICKYNLKNKEFSKCVNIEKEFISGIEGGFLLKDYLNLSLDYLGERYKLSDFIVHLILLKEESSSAETIEVYNTAYNLWIKLTTEYLVKDYDNPGNCLRLNVKKGDKTGFSYGFKDNTFLGSKVSEAKINLSSGELIILELFKSVRVGCE